MVTYHSANRFYVGSWYAYYNHDNWIAKFIGEEAPCTIVFFAWQFPNPSVPVDCQANTVMTFYESYFLSIYWSVTTVCSPLAYLTIAS